MLLTIMLKFWRAINWRTARQWALAGGFYALGGFVAPAQTAGWNYWSAVYIPNPLFGTVGAQLATDGTNIFYSTAVDGVYQADQAEGSFEPMPMTGFPSWDPVSNTNGYAVWHIAVAPHGTLLLAGSPVNLSNSNLSPPPSYYNNSLPVFYWWDATNELWQAATVTGKTYPYTANVGNFTCAPDGSVWTCSGYATYAYRSTNDGHSYTAFDINARVPTNYFPIPFAGLTTFGKLFSIMAGPNNEIVVGTETGGLLHTTNNGLNWTSLDPNFTNTQSLNPLGRMGDARVAGLDHYGNFLCANIELPYTYPGNSTWNGVRLIGYNPSDASYFNADGGFRGNFTPTTVVTPPSGVSFTFLDQNYQFQNGIYRSQNGKAWTQFNSNIPDLTGPWADFITNALAPGNCITACGNTIYVGSGNNIWTYDSTPLPLTNRPPTALPQNINLLKNTPANFTLKGIDSDGDALNFTVVSPPLHGVLSGMSPYLTYTPTTNTTGTDKLFFLADDGMATSAPTLVNFSVVTTNASIPVITLTSPTNHTYLIAPTNVIFTATANDANGVQQVNFYNGTNFLKSVTNSPYAYTWTNPPPGEYILNASVVNRSQATVWATPISLTILPTAPRLQIQNADGTTVAVRWPQVLDNNFFVETATNTLGPWTLCPYPAFFPPEGQTVTVPMADGQFFRLMHPQ